ncbi:hypothetical protein ADK67_39175 [Saccharothrix sp. NRRL B-16348]|uniref:hypothetical protein n=1 Tax=Saccharothrix sp. NRRL B-16348 TaxID=1415542 RepID=UPI0006AFD9E5|nr:hypothetical protein [Saccharothrix sp. NRRL B-16348]KOX16783.1 hypothetical protein ADK67_39175 [Saccharothrix sp. NRRL B-16348]
MSQPEMMLPDLPPRRSLPPDVRKRLRRRVLGRRLPAGRVPSGGVPSGGAARAPLAAAAAVVVLAAGGTIVAQSTQGDPDAVTPPSTAQSTAVSSSPGDSPVTSLTPGATGGEAERCGFGGGDVRFTLGLAGRRILVTRNGRFCEFTHTTVAHDRPQRRSPGLDAAHVVLAGTVDAARVGGVEITDRQGRTVSAVLRDGTFAARLPDQPPLTSNTVAEGFRVRVLDHDNQPIETVTLD